MNKLKIFYAKKLTKWIAKTKNHLKYLQEEYKKNMLSMTDEEALFFAQQMGYMKVKK